MAQKPSTTPIIIRNMSPIDYPELVRMDREFADVWDVRKYQFLINSPGYTNLVAEKDDRILAYGIVQSKDGAFRIRYIYVDEIIRRRGIGTYIINSFKNAILEQRGTENTKITTIVRETDLPGQQFFRDNGFKAVEILHHHFRNANPYETGYGMIWKKEYNEDSNNKQEEQVQDDGQN